LRDTPSKEKKLRWRKPERRFRPVPIKGAPRFLAQSARGEETARLGGTARGGSRSKKDVVGKNESDGGGGNPKGGKNKFHDECF